MLDPDPTPQYSTPRSSWGPRVSCSLARLCLVLCFLKSPLAKTSSPWPAAEAPVLVPLGL